MLRPIDTPHPKTNSGAKVNGATVSCDNFEHLRAVIRCAQVFSVRSKRGNRQSGEASTDVGTDVGADINIGVASFHVATLLLATHYRSIQEKWTQTIIGPFNCQLPSDDGDRNHRYGF